VPRFGARLWGRTLDSLVVSLPIGLLVRFTLGHGVRGTLVALLTSLTYETVCVTVWGQTLGKHAAGTRVVAWPTGKPPTASRALRRALVTTTPTLILLFPGSAILRSFVIDAIALAIYLPLLRSGERRGLHDQFGGTIVVESQ
jgi:uncharacterized RDD family membrane protein YckC